MMRYLGLLTIIFILPFISSAQDAEQLYYNLRSKVLSVKDYTAEVKMKINVSYMKIPDLAGKLYYKAPDKMRMERKDGISILPRKNVNLTLSNLIPAGKVSVIDLGTRELNGKKARILKVIPDEDNTGIVLTKIWIDEAGVLALRTETTTQNEGTVVMDMQYGKFVRYSLPDKVTITMDVKEYKLPKGVTMDYSEVQKPSMAPKTDKENKGTIEIAYLSYVVNKGLDDAIFADKDAKK